MDNSVIFIIRPVKVVRLCFSSLLSLLGVRYYQEKNLKLVNAYDKMKIGEKKNNTEHHLQQQDTTPKVEVVLR